MDSETTQLFLLVVAVSLSLGAIILSVIGVRYSDLAKHRKDVARYCREMQKEFDVLEEKVWTLQRKYNLVVAREKSNNSERTKSAKDSHDGDNPYDRLQGESDTEWKARMRREMATGNLRRPN